MLKTVVVLQTVVVGAVSILLALTSQPPPPSTPTDGQVRQFETFTTPGFKLDDKTAADLAKFKALQADPNASPDALANALKALKEAQSKVDCTFALQMKEVAPDADPKIHAPVRQLGDARIRRILPPPCLMTKVRTTSGAGSVVTRVEETK